MSFILSKLLWALVSPGSLLAFLLVIGLAAATGPWPRGKRWGRRLCGFVAAALVAIAILPVGEWALTPLENRAALASPDQVDGIIVLGGDEKPALSEARGMPIALESLRRYVVFSELARRYPDAKLVFSGGSPIAAGERPRVLDSEVATELMTRIGVPTDRLIVEKTSRNTYENAVFSADILRPTSDQTWLLVTSAWHMPRALGCFRKAGWNVEAAPAGYFTPGDYRFSLPFRFSEQMHLLTLAVHEYIGLGSYWLMGRTSALWPN